LKLYPDDIGQHKQA